LKRSSAGAKNAKSCRRIIGFDPGLAFTGWGVLDSVDGKVVYVGHGQIKTTTGLSRDRRLFSILKSVRLILDDYKPREAAVETLYFGKNVSSAIPVAEARGVIMAVLAERGLPVFELTPNAIKKGVVGFGRADKNQVQEMVRVILGLSEIPKPDHAADALGAAICAANSIAPYSGGAVSLI